MIKLFILLVVATLPFLLFYLNISYAKDGGVLLSFFALFVTVVKIWESFFTSKENKAIRYHGDWTLILTAFLYFLTGIFIILEFFFLNDGLNTLLTSIGFLVFLFSIFFRHWCIKVLGNQWAIHITETVRLNTSPMLVTSGPYKFIRHPIYLSYMLDLIGLAIIFNAFYSFIFIFLINTPSYIVRAHREESFLIKRFGDKYNQYKKSTWFLFPYC